MTRFLLHIRYGQRGWTALVFTWVFITLSAPAAAQLSLPHTLTISFQNLSETASFVIDLGTLPTRPELVAEAFPDSGHPDMILEIEITDFQVAQGPGACPGPTSSFVSQPAPGPNAAPPVLFWDCDPVAGAFTGDTASVFVRVLSFGSSPAPANVDIVIRGVTQVPTATDLVEFAPTFAQQSLSLLASKDTTIYEASPSGSNGQGDYLWAGSDTVLVLPEGTMESRSIHSLIAFDVAGFVPATAIVDDASIDLDVESIVGGSQLVSIHRIAADTGIPPVDWVEGDADAAGSEFSAGISSVPSATWDDRESPTLPWGIEGGDPNGPPGDPLSTPLDVRLISSLGSNVFSSSLLNDAVQDMATTGEDADGFLLTGTLSPADNGVQFASSDSTSGGSSSPEMVVFFTPTEPYQEEFTRTGAVSFINEGQNFRWIYDLDFDDIFETDIGGICTVVNPDTQVLNVPYTYQFTGTPGYTGLDCCTWWIDSQQTGTRGTGQAIFFHGLDPADPNNLPPDSDGDGIRDNCDNCVTVPNGPSLGTCLTGVSAGLPCHSEQECVGGGCSLSQEDINGDFQGDACPEPGLAAMLMSGSFLLSSLRRRRLGQWLTTSDDVRRDLNIFVA